LTFRATNAAALNTAQPQIKAWVDQALTAIQKDDQAAAVMSLRELRDSGQLNSDQALAVQDMMVRSSKVLAERAAQGDQSAINALNMLSLNRR
jgi:hypothetical protein